MAAKRKISIRKVIQVLFTLVAAVCCIVAMVSASRMDDARMVASVDVHINNAKKYHFIEEKQILDEAINDRNIDVLHTPAGKLDMQAMEQILKADPWVADAQLYIDNAKVLHIIVTQRLPQARIFAQDGNSYYIDSTLSVMPLSPSFIYYTSVVTNMPVIKNDSAGTAMKKQVLKMVRTIQSDSFWNVQVSQIVVDSGNCFELIPVLGDQRIIFGDTSRIKDKLDNLTAFYKGVLNKIGWDRYETLDVRYKGQVIASPAIPNKGPVDKAIATMNWVTSIVQTEARKDSLRAAAEPRQVNDDGKKDPPAPKENGKDKDKDKGRDKDKGKEKGKPVAQARDAKGRRDDKPKDKAVPKPDADKKKNDPKKPAKEEPHAAHPRPAEGHDKK